MEKKWIFCICICLFLFAFSGCGAQIPDMTDEEREAISKYAADLLLKYDASLPSRLVEIEEEAEPTPEPIPTPEPVEVDKPEETEAPDVTETPQETTIPQETEEPKNFDMLEDTLLLPEGVSLVYCECEATQSFVDETDGYQTLEADMGKLLLVVRFKLLNNSNTVQNVDMLQDNIVYKVFVDEQVINGMITMVGNDLTTFIGALQPEESKDVILFAEVDEVLWQNSQSVKVEFHRQELVSEIMVK